VINKALISLVVILAVLLCIQSFRLDSTKRELNQSKDKISSLQNELIRYSDDIAILRKNILETNESLEKISKAAVARAEAAESALRQAHKDAAKWEATATDILLAKPAPGRCIDKIQRH
jgi:septal ring factor EnvC (AmiA/AmiB activator)